VASFTRGKVVTAERALAVVAGHAALRSAGGMVIRRLWLSDLAPLRLSWFDLVTIVTRQLLR
jgi:hypothetical protein